MQAYHEYTAAKESYLDQQVKVLVDFWHKHSQGPWVTDAECVRIRWFIRKLGVDSVVDAMEQAISREKTHSCNYAFAILHAWRRKREESQNGTTQDA
jgi:hypothetical protein